MNNTQNSKFSNNLLHKITCNYHKNEPILSFCLNQFCNGPDRMGCQKCLSEGGQHYSHPQRSLNHILKAMDYIKFENQGIKDIKHAIEIITEDYTKIRNKIELQFKQVMEQLETAYDNCVYKLQQPLDNFSKLREIAEKYDNNIEFLKVVQQQEDKEQIQDRIASIIRNFDNFIIEDQNEYNNKLNEMGLYQEINKIVLFDTIEKIMFDLEINFKQILNNYDTFANPFNHQKFMNLKEQKPLKPVLLTEQSGHWVFDVQYVNSYYFASCSTESSLKIWNSHTLKLEKEFFGHETNTMINSLLVLNSNIIVTGGSDSNIFVWDIKKGNYVCILTGHNEWVTKLVKVSDWEFLSLGNDRVVNLWNILKKKSVANYIGHKGKINDMTHLRYTDIFLTCSDDKTIRGWSLLESNACVFIYNVPINISTSPQSILQIKDDYFLTGHQHYILVWKISTSQVMKQFKAHNDYVSGLKLMNGDCFASLSLDKTFSLYQIEGLKLIANFNGHQNQVTGISSLDLNTIITSSLDHTIKIWK